jgi:hypothetical protein
MQRPGEIMTTRTIRTYRTINGGRKHAPRIRAAGSEITAIKRLG